MKIEIPGYPTLDIENIVFDYNGTIAIDGIILDCVKEKIKELSYNFNIMVLTADTHGTAKKEVGSLPIEVLTFPTGNASEEKLKIIKQLGSKKTIAIGNGRNDISMCSEAVLSIAIIGHEGMYSKLISSCDIAVTSIEDALDLLIKKNRLIATLRG